MIRRRRLGRRLAALVLGVVFTLVGLELALALSARLFLVLQESENRRALSGGADEVRVLALGESTTAVAGDETGKLLVTRTAWPAQAEEALNRRQEKVRFDVVNLGSMGGTSSTVLDRLEPALATYRPQAIVVMMGIKDTADEHVQGPTPERAFPYSLRTVQLLRWATEAVELRLDAHPTDVRSVEDIPRSMRDLRGQLQAFVRETRLLEPGLVPADAVDQLTIALYLWDIGRYDQAEASLRATIRRYDVGYNLLAEVLDTDARADEALGVYADAIPAHPDEGMYRVGLAEHLTRMGRYAEAREVLDDAFSARATFRRPELVTAFLLMADASLARAQGDYERSLALLEQVDRGEAAPGVALYFPEPAMMWNLGMGETYAEMERWAEAEAHLTAVVRRHPQQGAPMWMLAKVYRATGQTAKEEALRRSLLPKNQRVAEYFELAKLFRLTGNDDRIPALFDEAVAEIPVLAENYRRLYRLADAYGAQLFVMQYPGFRADVMQKYAPPAPNVRYIDNEHLFDADPDGLFFEPQFPFSFSHYTKEGARLLGEHVADELLPVYGAP